MTIWKILSLLTLVTPFFTLILGLICWRFPPKGPTWALGYRSRRARASDESWLFAQNMAGQIWFCLGLVLLIVSLFVCKGLEAKTIEAMCRSALICILIQDLFLLLSIIPTEVLLMRRFDRFGHKRRGARRSQPEMRKAPAHEETLTDDSAENDSPET